MRVELLHHPGCRSAAAVHELVQECLRGLAIAAHVTVSVGDYPSPTLLIDGIDVMTRAPAPATGSVCRLDVPTRDHVLTALTTRLAGG